MIGSSSAAQISFNEVAGFFFINLEIWRLVRSVRMLLLPLLFFRGLIPLNFANLIQEIVLLSTPLIFEIMEGLSPLISISCISIIVIQVIKEASLQILPSVKFLDL